LVFKSFSQENAVFKRYSSMVLVITLVCTLCGTPVFAQALSDPEVKPQTLVIEEEPARPPENGVKANQKALMGLTPAGKLEAPNDYYLRVEHNPPR
jgi:hypothetical protein